jgi:hypothetical protein
LQEASDDVAAVPDAIDGWKAGDDGLSLDEAFDSVRRALDETRTSRPLARSLDCEVERLVSWYHRNWF